MLVPSGLSKKERKEYDERYAPKQKQFVNKGPAGGLRPPGGDKDKVVTKKSLKDSVDVKEKKKWR